MLKLILGTAGTGKTAMITEEIARRAKEGEDKLCLIVPEQFSYEAERELCVLCGDSISLHAEVLSFSRLSLRVAQELGTGGRSYVDGAGRLLCVNLALREIGGSLSLYTAAQRDPRLQQQLLLALEELRTAGVGSEALLSKAELASPRLGAKLRDLALCMEGYEAVLENGRADPAHRLRRLAECISESSLGKEGRFYIDGFTDFTAVELEVIRAMLASGRDVTVCLTCDGLYTDSEHFRPARAAANTLKRMAQQLNLETDITFSEPDSDDISPIRFFAAYLFHHTPDKRENPGEYIRLFKAPDIYGECEFAAARALELVRKGCRYGDIAVAARGFEDYRPALEEVFRLYDVPLFTAGRGSILQKPVPAFIESAFRVIQGGWDTEDVLSYIKTGLTGLTQEEADILCGYVTLWSIRGSMWSKAEPWRQHPQGFGRDETEESKELLGRIDGLRRRLAAPLLKLAGRGKEGKTALDQISALTDFFGEISLPLTLEAHAKFLDDAGLSRQADEFVQLWGLMCRALSQTADILGDRPMEQEEFSKLFMLTLSHYDLSSIPFSSDAVSAGELDRMRRRHIKHLIILGASDDRIPMPADGGNLLTEEDREALASLGMDLGGGADSLSRELSLIYNCVSLPSDSLSICWPEANMEGAACRPSLLVSRADKLFDINTEIIDPRTLKLSAPGPAFLIAADSGGGAQGALAGAWFAETPEGCARLESVRERADGELESLSEESVNALYGRTLSISPSRADTFFSCPFQYFMRYGLRLNEKERAGFEAPELGSYMHCILENCAREISDSTGFDRAGEELVYQLADKYTDIYIKEKLDGFEDKSARFVFLFNRLRTSVKRVVWDMVKELARSDFRPLDFELSFSRSGEGLPPIRLSDGENCLYINGIVDRVDGWFKDGKLYLRVIDYKTGRKSFSLSDVWYGMGMQMLLYLFSLEEEGGERYDGEIVPAGVLYVPARDSVVKSDRDLTEEELASERSKSLRRSGLLLEDEEVLHAMEHGDSPQYIPVSFDKGVMKGSTADKGKMNSLKHHVENCLLGLSKDIGDGKIQAEPSYRNASENACLWCPYRRVCRFDGSRDKCRSMETIKPAEFWRRLDEKEDGKNE